MIQNSNRSKVVAVVVVKLVDSAEVEAVVVAECSLVIVIIIVGSNNVYSHAEMACAPVKKMQAPAGCCIILMTIGKPMHIVASRRGMSDHIDDDDDDDSPESDGEDVDDSGICSFRSSLSGVVVLFVDRRGYCSKRIGAGTSTGPRDQDYKL